MTQNTEGSLKTEGVLDPDDGTVDLSVSEFTHDDVSKLLKLTAYLQDKNTVLAARCEAFQHALLMVSGNWKKGKK